MRATSAFKAHPLDRKAELFELRPELHGPLPYVPELPVLVELQRESGLLWPPALARSVQRGLAVEVDPRVFAIELLLASVLHDGELASFVITDAAHPRRTCVVCIAVPSASGVPEDGDGGVAEGAPSRARVSKYTIDECVRRFRVVLSLVRLILFLLGTLTSPRMNFSSLLEPYPFRTLSPV